MSNISNLPLQDMIAGVVRTASEKLASHPDDWSTKQAMDSSKCGNCGEKTAGEKCACATKTASITDSDYIEKLASACDFLSQNVENIEAPARGVLGDAISKLAGVPVPAPNPAGSLPVEASMAGEQQYKKDKPKAGFDAAASTAGTPEGTAGLPGGATQMLNDMESAPGQASGSVPTAKYPASGPLAKSAGAKLDALKAGGNRYLELMKGGKKLNVKGNVAPVKGVRGGNDMNNFIPGKVTSKAGKEEGLKSMGTRAATGVGVLGAGAALKGGKDKTAGEAARQMILSKLAGEDVMKASVSSGKGGGALVGDGELQVMDVTQHTSNPTDGSGYGNQQRGLIASNEAATNYDKGQAKKPRVPELAEVLKNPAFSPKHDSKLNEQLQNTGKAGVKIAGAQMREFLKQAAADGSLTQEMVDNVKVASDGSGCSCGGEGSCRTCKLESLKNDAQKTSMGDMGGAGSMGGTY